MNKNSINNINISSLVDSLKNEDKKYAALSKRFQIMYWILAPVYLVLAIMNLIEDFQPEYVVTSLCMFSSILIFALIFRFYHKEYNSVDYSLPTLEMLKKAADRYKPFRLKGKWVLLAVILMDISLSFNSSLGFELIRTQISFLGAVLFAIFIGFLVWRKKYKPLRDNVIGLIKEMNS